MSLDTGTALADFLAFSFSFFLYAFYSLSAISSLASSIVLLRFFSKSSLARFDKQHTVMVTMTAIKARPPMTPPIIGANVGLLPSSGVDGIIAI